MGHDSKLLSRIDLGDDYFLILGQDQSRLRSPRPHKVRAQVTGSHILSLFFLHPYLFLSPCLGILNRLRLVDFVIVIILPDLPRWVRDRNSTEFRALYLFVLSAGPTCCLCSHEMWTKNGLIRLCHITCFSRQRSGLG